MTTLLKFLLDGEPGALLGTGLVAVSLLGACFLKLRDRRIARYGRHSPYYVRRHPAENPAHLRPAEIPVHEDQVGVDFAPGCIDEDWAVTYVRQYIDGPPTRPIPVVIPVQTRRTVEGVERVVA